MYPADRQLIKQLRKVARQLLAEVERPEHKAALGTMDAVINELLLRGDGEFYAGYYRTGRVLLDEAQRKLGGTSQLPAELPPFLSDDAVAKQILALSAALESAVNALAADDADDTRKLLDRIVDWELQLLSYRLRPASVPDAPVPSGRAIDKAAFEEYLRRAKPDWRDLRILDFHRVAGGFSKITILLETEDSLNGRQSLAIRAAQPIQLCNIEGSDIRNEFPLVSKAFANGVPVAEPLWMETDLSHFGTRFFVSRKVTGRNFGTATGATGQLPVETVKSLAETMASIHGIPMRRGDNWIEKTHFARWLDMGRARGNTLGSVAEWKKQAREANINLALYGLRFAHEYAARLPGAIARAEAVRHLQ